MPQTETEIQETRKRQILAKLDSKTADVDKYLQQLKEANDTHNVAMRALLARIDMLQSEREEYIRELASLM